MGTSTNSILLGLMRKHRSALVISTLLLLTGSLISLTSPWLASQLTRILISDSGAVLSLDSLFVLWFLVLCLQALSRFVSGLWLAQIGETVSMELRLLLFRHLQVLPLSYFEDKTKGSVISHFTTDASILSRLITHVVTGLLPQLLTLLVATVVLAWLDLYLGLLAIVLAVVFVLVTRILGRSVRPISERIMELHGRMISQLEEALQMVPIIKTFVVEPKIYNNFEVINSEIKDTAFSYNLKQIRMAPIIQLISGLAIIGAVWVMSSRVISGEMNLPKLVSIVFFGILMTRPLGGLAAAWGQFQSARTAAERLSGLLKSEGEYSLDNNRKNSQYAQDNGNNDGLAFNNGDIEFDSVSFNYKNRAKLFADFSLTINQGETIAITGRNGTGKSTLAKLMVRFEQPTSGMLKIAGKSISEYELSSLRRNIGYVPQKNQLFNTSLRQNICLASDLSDNEVNEIVRQLDLEELVESLPAGLDELVGEQGVKISGGQSQRVALARAIITRPPILILDEATSMFDPDAEIRYVESCRKLLKDSTVLLITHRPASLELADRRISLDDQVV